MANREKTRITFAYVVVTAITVTSIILYSLTVGLRGWQSFLFLVGSLILAWSIVFTFVEVRRLARISKNGGQAPEEESDFYPPRRIIVDPPTGEPYPHHEDHLESAGQDQGQLTARLSGVTPLIGNRLSHRGKRAS